MHKHDLFDDGLLDVAIRIESALECLAHAATANVLEGFIGAAMIDGELRLFSSLPDSLSEHERALLLGALVRQSHTLLTYPEAVMAATAVPPPPRLT